MKIFNVRFGLATNSSSSHSLIFLKEGVKAVDYDGHGTVIENIENNVFESFGWQRFTAASAKAKLFYLGVLLRDRLVGELPTNIADMVCEKWLDGMLPSADIDHQSWFYLPSAFNSKLPDEDFFEALKKYFLQEKFAILGGNDNESTVHTLNDGSGFTLPLPYDCGRRTNYVCRYDSKYDFWTVFEPYNGTKIRFRFTNDPKSMTVTPDKACAPELVDIKITDFCPFGCKFCYQSSTTAGDHADGTTLYSIAQSLGSLKVFEVALGGGEPTLYPHFEQILQNFRSFGIVPNFTTKNLQWLRDPKKWNKILEHAGAFAFSPNDVEDIRELATLLNYNGIHHDRANLHLVMGTMNKWEYVNLLRAAEDANLSVTLLGYKKHGFGLDYCHQTYDWWLDEAKKLFEERQFRSSISIDTVLAKQYEQQLLDADVPKWLFTTEEGKFSCYIDAVSKKMGPSSFCDPKEMIDIVPDNPYGWRNVEAERIEEVFAQF